MIGVGCIPAPMQRASLCMRGPRPRCCPTLRSWATSAQSTSTPRVRAIPLGCVGTGSDAALLGCGGAWGRGAPAMCAALCISAIACGVLQQNAPAYTCPNHQQCLRFLPRFLHRVVG